MFFLFNHLKISNHKTEPVAIEKAIPKQMKILRTYLKKFGAKSVFFYKFQSHKCSRIQIEICCYNIKLIHKKFAAKGAFFLDLQNKKATARTTSAATLEKICNLFLAELISSVGGVSVRGKRNRNVVMIVVFQLKNHFDERVKTFLSQCLKIGCRVIRQLINPLVIHAFFFF